MVALFSGPRVLKYSARMITVGMPWILNIQTWHPLLAPSTTLRFTLTYSKQLHRTAKVLKTDRDRWSCLEYPIFVLRCLHLSSCWPLLLQIWSLSPWGFLHWPPDVTTVSPVSPPSFSPCHNLSYHAPSKASKALGLWANQWTYPKLDNRGSSVICFTSPFFRRGNDGGFFFFRTKVRHSRRGWEKQATSRQNLRRVTLKE